MQVYKVINIGFVFLQMFTLKLQKVEILSTKAKIMKQSIFSISFILEFYKLDWLKSDMNSFKSRVKQFSFQAIGGMQF